MTPLKIKTPLVEEEGHKLILLPVKILLKVVSYSVYLIYFVSNTVHVIYQMRSVMRKH